MNLYTIGFQKKNAGEFFESLKSNGVKRLVDIRLDNTSQLAGFTKKSHLPYLLDQVCGIPYVHCLDLAPTRELRDEMKKRKKKDKEILDTIRKTTPDQVASTRKKQDDENWKYYEARFKKLMEDRKIEEPVKSVIKDGDCLLCSEVDPAACHRRLVVERLASKWDDVTIVHI